MNKKISTRDMSSKEIFKCLVHYNSTINYSLENPEKMPVKETVEDMKRMNTTLLNDYAFKLNEEQKRYAEKIRILYGLTDEKNDK